MSFALKRVSSFMYQMDMPKDGLRLIQQLEHTISEIFITKWIMLI